MTPIQMERLSSWGQRWRHWLLGGFVVLVAALLFEALRHLMAEMSYAEVIQAVQDTPPRAMALAVLATALSYLALTGYDHSSLRYVGAKVAYPVVAKTAFIAYALANTIGLGVLTGGAVRMRLYGAAGVEAGQISRAIAFNAAAFGIGVTVVGAAALLWGAASVAPVAHLPVLALRMIAALILAAAAGLLLRCFQYKTQPAGETSTRRLPSGPLAVQQLLFSALDIAASAAVLWLLLPAGAVGFPAFVGFYAIATVLGIISHVPGGLGVFEAIMLVALGGHVPTETLAGALVLYRVIYYLLPLLVALGLLVISELQRGVAAPVTRAAAGLAPLLLAAYTLVIGVLLLVSGVTPATDAATELLSLHVPLPLVEAAHFLGSIAGLGLLFVARGMLLRLDAAWWAGLVLAAVSLVLCLPKGIALSEATLLSVLVAALALSRKQFTRKASLLAQPFTGGWLLSVGAILAALTGLLFFAYQDVEYRRDLWWQFEFDGHAPRSLRALVAVALVALAIAVRQLLRPPQRKLVKTDEASLSNAEAIIRQQDSADACLALMGDKQLLFSESGKAFVMFGRHGRSWVSLFDPVGPQSEWPELVWRFLERARESGGRASFYQVRPQTLPAYLDAGLRVFKLGEDAHVSLPDFSLKGKARANLRQGVNRAEREGLSFEVIPVTGVPQVMAEIKAISDAWLGEHNTAEKGFSLGAFDETYVRRQPVAVVRQGTRAVAFATLMATERRIEACVDLMRHLPDAPRGSMDYLFAQLMLHFQAQGFLRFGLGMAPLSGMAEHPLAPNWHRLGRLLFSHGEHFYNFQGLRAFKEKFDPVWEPRYLASPGGVTPLIVLTDTAALISGGLRGVIGK
ncbi:bifunctional lysylphosphatidylglycerol flippase/synthetase MprF [Nevskia ramosa]|uniref:bifunctional lysylphosphatidylglycerol flippase/synthetase MprF n=1 Tax=Nevskia ramosa TaxID=64002 RepID=UPI0023550098|nr:bifunctional lysylphosphatidylglycerol flippase/synthetase MprF [Nevskia ramosa]